MAEEYTLTVHPFRTGTGKEAALKPLEEAAEAYAEWQKLDDLERDPGMTHGDAGHVVGLYVDDLAYEVADCVQACVNLADRYGIDLDTALMRVEVRNRARGRYAEGGEA